MKDIKVDVAKLNKYLDGKISSPMKCSLCGQVDTFDSEDYVMGIPQFDFSIFNGYRVVPVIPLTCRNCGNVILLNAINVGIIPPDGIKEESGNGSI